MFVLDAIKFPKTKVFKNHTEVPIGIQKRQSLLSKSEIDDIYSLPEFNDQEREIYFDFNKQEMEVACKYHTLNTRVCFLLSLGYFKAKQQFYRPSWRNSDDAKYILARFFTDEVSSIAGQIDSRTYRKQKDDILALLDCQAWSPDFEVIAKKKLCELLRYYPKPHNATRQLLEYLVNQNIVLPSYRVIQDIFSSAFSEEEKRQTLAIARQKSLVR